MASGLLITRNRNRVYLNKTNIKIIILIFLLLILNTLYLKSNFWNSMERTNDINAPVLKATEATSADFYEVEQNNNLEELPCFVFRAEYEKERISFDGYEYPRVITAYHDESFDFECFSQLNFTKRIFLWNNFSPFIMKKFGLGGRELFEKYRCPITNCEVTKDLNKLAKSDYVLFHIHDSIDDKNHLKDFVDKYLTNRPRTQRWVYANFETPIQKPLRHLSVLNGFFNLTATYLRDSDFNSIYQGDSRIRWVQKSKDFDINKNEYHSDKKKFAAIILNDCNSKDTVNKYISLLKEHIQIDVYGKCGIPFPVKNDTLSNSNYIFEYIGSNYKYFLSFENSFCKDYISEKFFRIIRYNSLPVVLGSGDYSYHIPKSAYVNALDFRTPKKLAEYLIFLDKNKPEFNSYFRWKQFAELMYYPHSEAFENEISLVNLFCELCMHLNLELFFGVKQKVINNLEDFNNKKSCYQPTFNKDGSFKLKNINQM